MKTLTFLFLFIITSTSLVAQNAVGFQLTQTFTTGTQAKMMMEGSERAIGHFQVGIKVNLSTDDYSRLGAEAGFSFTNMPIPFTKMKYAMAPMIGYGMFSDINDDDIEVKNIPGWDTSIEFSFAMNSWLNIIVIPAYTQRRDLDVLGLFDVAIGVQFDINTDYGKRQAQKGTRF